MSFKSNDMHEYEFSTKSMQNAGAAVCRQLSGRVQAEPAVKLEFNKMAEQYWRFLDGKLNFAPTPDLFAYAEKFPPGKRDVYLKQVIHQLAGARIP